jgi:uncharacterized protein
MIGPVLVDTGPIVAVFAASDPQHNVCVEQLRALTGALVTCWPVVTEAAWLLRSSPQAVERLLSSLEGLPFQLAPLAAQDLSGVAAILAKYRDLNLQLADAALLHLGNRENIDTIFTLDRRDFGILRLARGKKFRIVP